MTKKQDTKRYTAKELEQLRAEEGSRTDWSKVDAVTDQQLQAAIEADEDETGIKPDWTQARLVTPQPKQSIHLRVKPEVLEWFKSEGKGYQTRMNAVLEQYMKANKHHQEANGR
jgi:uncharacterized protein (DUF4415 family)